MNPERRNRGSNFSKEEEMLLLDEIVKYKDIIECKTTNKTSNVEKNEAWAKIAANFNAINKVYRPESQLRHKYDNLKLKARKCATAEHRSLTGTGGGPSTSTMDMITEKVLSLVNTKTVMGLFNPYDGDAPEIINISNTPIVLESEQDVIPDEAVELLENVEIVENIEAENVEIVENIEADNSEMEKMSRKRKWESYTPAKLRTPKSKKLRQASIMQSTEKKDKYYDVKIKIMEEELKILRRKEEREEEKHQQEIEKHKKEMKLLDLEIQNKQKMLDS